jgi:hypothetical protein
MNDHGKPWRNVISRVKSWFVHQRSCQQSNLAANYETLGEGNDEFSFRSNFFTCRKRLRHRADGFTSPPKQGLRRIFIALRPGLNPGGLDPIASTLTITPMRWLLNLTAVFPLIYNQNSPIHFADSFFLSPVFAIFIFGISLKWCTQSFLIWIFHHRLVGP